MDLGPFGHQILVLFFLDFNLKLEHLSPEILLPSDFDVRFFDFSSFGLLEVGEGGRLEDVVLLFLLGLLLLGLGLGLWLAGIRRL